MAFTSLSIDVQNLLMAQFTFFFKFILIFGFMAFACFYLFYWKQHKEKETPFYSIGLIRLFVTTTSGIYIVLFPLALILMSPEFSFTQIQDVFYPLYAVLITMIFIGLTVDFLYIAPAVTVRIMGIDVKDKRVRKVYTMVNKLFKKNG